MDRRLRRFDLTDEILSFCFWQSGLIWWWKLLQLARLLRMGKSQSNCYFDVDVLLAQKLFERYFGWEWNFVHFCNLQEKTTTKFGHLEITDIIFSGFWRDNWFSRRISLKISFILPFVPSSYLLFQLSITLWEEVLSLILFWKNRFGVVNWCRRLFQIEQSICIFFLSQMLLGIVNRSRRGNNV